MTYFLIVAHPMVHATSMEDVKTVCVMSNLVLMLELVEINNKERGGGEMRGGFIISRPLLHS
jgi:hypothetical protein